MHCIDAPTLGGDTMMSPAYGGRCGHSAHKVRTNSAKVRTPVTGRCGQSWCLLTLHRSSHIEVVIREGVLFEKSTRFEDEETEDRKPRHFTCSQLHTVASAGNPSIRADHGELSMKQVEVADRGLRNTTVADRGQWSQAAFVAWWDANVRRDAHTLKQNAAVADRGQRLSADYAKEATGISKQQVSRWRGYLKTPDKYRDGSNQHQKANVTDRGHLLAEQAEVADRGLRPDRAFAE